jgi:hypothetical protein
MPDLVPFIDLAAQRRRLGGALKERVLRVKDHGAFIMGLQVEQLETELGRASVLIETHLKFGSAAGAGQMDARVQEFAVGEAH